MVNSNNSPIRRGFWNGRGGTCCRLMTVAAGCRRASQHGIHASSTLDTAVWRGLSVLWSNTNPKLKQGRDRLWRNFEVHSSVMHLEQTCFSLTTPGIEIEHASVSELEKFFKDLSISGSHKFFVQFSGLDTGDELRALLNRLQMS